MALSGFGAGEAEGLRRAMSRKRSEAAIRAHHQHFVEGAVENGAAPEVAERVWGQVQGFSGFGFPKAHSAAFALLAYQSAWLREHYGPEFLCSLLNEQPMGFYPPDALVHEAQRRGIEVLGPDVNRSGVECSVESPAVRIGLGYVNGIREDEARALVVEREDGGAYRGVADLASRSGMSREGLERLAWAEALRTVTDGDRRVALWRLGISPGAERIPAGTQLSLPIEPPPAPELAQLGEWEALLADYRSTGMTLGAHPMQLLRGELADSVVLSSDLPRIADGAGLEIAGMVVARQRPATAKGVVFMLIEDEAGQVNLVLPPPVFERFRGVARTAPLVKVRGRLERRDGVINVLVSELARLERPDLPLAEVRTIEPVPGQELGRDPSGREIEPVTELQAVAPAAHSFGRRGR